MARKDVELVIRAKDEATKAVTAVTAALKTFSLSQDDLETKAAKTDTALGKLGAALQELNTKLGGVSAAGKIASELDKARTAMSALETETARATGEVIGYTKEARAAAAETAKLEQAAREVAAAIDKQSKTLQASKNAQRELTSITDRATAARRKLTDADKRLTEQIEAQGLKLALARGRFRSLQEEINRTDAPTKKLQQSFGAMQRAVGQAGDKLNEFKTTQAVVRESLGALDRNVAQANLRLKGQANTYDQQVVALSALKGKQEEIAVSTRNAAAQQNALERAARASTATLKAQDDAYLRGAKNLRQIEAAAGEAGVAMANLASGVRGPLLQAFGRQKAVVNALELEFRNLSASAQRYSQEVRASGGRDSAIVAQFERMRAAASAARREFREQQTALGAMRQTLRTGATDIQGFAAQQERIAATSRAAARSLQEYRAAVEGSNRASRSTASITAQAGANRARLASETSRLALATRDGARGTGAFATAMRSFYGEGRQALSFVQRLRSEILALIAAYGGFFAVINLVRNTVNAFRTLEAATSRLNAIFDGDQRAVAAELDFLRRSAERLGIEFGTLAGQYSQFAVATKDTVLEGAETRRIFIAVAEAARVNKLSLDQLNGVFLALTQIVSKGKVTMEELRRQLGDRLPGAIQIMAAGLGVSTTELERMLEAGEVTSDALSGFADELERRFGGALPAALQTTTTAIGKFENAVFQALLTIGNSGFIEAFTGLVRDMTSALSDASGQAFLQSIGGALSGLVGVLGAVVKNFEALVVVVAAFLAYKIAPFIIAMLTQLGFFNVMMISTRGALRGMQAELAVTTGFLARTGVAVRGLTLAFRTLLSTTGIGLIVVAIGAAIGAWSTRADEATEAMAEHRKVVDEIKNAYDEVGQSTEKWGRALDKISVTQARERLRVLQNTVKDLQREIAETRGLYREFNDIPELEDLIFLLEGGGISAEVFKRAIDDLAESGKITATVAVEYQNLADKLDAAEKNTEEAAAVLRTLTREATNADRALLGTQEAAENQATSAKKAADRTEKFGAALEKLGEFAPEVASELEKLKKAADLTAAFQSALKLAKGYEEILEVFRRYQAALNSQASQEALEVFQGQGGNALEQTIRLLQAREGFSETAKFDVNAFRAGFGSDTTTLSDGSIKAITEGMRVSFDDAMRDLIRRIGEFRGTIEGQVGAGRFNSFSPEQQAALTSIAYNYGSLPARLVEAVRSGTTVEIANAIRRLGSDNDGINNGRRLQEAAIFESGGPAGVSTFVEAEEKRLDLLERAAEVKEREAKATLQTLADGGFALEQQELLNLGKEREAAILEAIRQAKSADKNITKEQLALVAEQAGKLFDLKEAAEAGKRAREEAVNAEGRVNELLTIRQQLTEQLNLLQAEGGNPAAVENTRLGIANINDELRLAIEQAIGLWEALGGAGADVAIAKLNTLQLTLKAEGKQVYLDWKRVGDLFADGLTSAFDRFSKAVAEGKSIGEAARESFLQFASDFLRQIAQMIIKQAILNALKSFGFPGVGVGHHGGMVSGVGRRKRNVDPGLFVNALRFHSGGLAGIGPDERAIIAKDDEEILTRGDPRHRLNGGLNPGGPSEPSRGALTVINAFDAPGFLQAALDGSGGEVLLNYVRNNPTAVRAALEGS